MELYDILKELDQKFKLLRDGKNFVNIGCKEGSALKYAGEKNKTGKIIGIELNEFFQVNLQQLQTKFPNIEIKTENPMNNSVWNQIVDIDVIFNTLKLEAVKLFQATENSLKSAKDGARIINLYKSNFLPENEHIQFAEKFIQRLPLKSTQFLTIKGQLISVSTKKGVLG